MTDRPTINVVQCALFAEAQAAPARQPSRKKLRGASRHQESAWTPTSRGLASTRHSAAHADRDRRMGARRAAGGRRPARGGRRGQCTIMCGRGRCSVRRSARRPVRPAQCRLVVEERRPAAAAPPARRAHEHTTCLVPQVTRPSLVAAVGAGPQPMQRRGSQSRWQPAAPPGCLRRHGGTLERQSMCLGTSPRNSG